MIEILKDILKCANQYDLWNMLTFFIILPTSIIGIYYLVYGKRYIKNLNFMLNIHRDNSNYPFKIIVEIRNYTGKSVVISEPYFRYNKAKPDPKATGDIITKNYEIKFPNITGKFLTEIDYLIRHKENISTFIPLDPNQTEDEIKKLMDKSQIGSFHCECTWILKRPEKHKLTRKI